MSFFVYVVVALVLMYVVDLLICYVYCLFKKKQDKGSKHKANTLETGSTSTSCKKRKGIIHKLKQSLNGWMIYRVKRLGKVPFQRYRILILKYIFGMQIGKNVVIYGWDTIRHPWNIIVGDGTIIGNDAYLDGRNGLVIGNNVNVSGRATIHTEQHDVNDSLFRSLNSGGEVVIGDRAWISSNTIVLPGVHIGEGAVLAAGALANKNIESYGIYVGIPAKMVGKRNNNLEYIFDGDYLPFI